MNIKDYMQNVTTDSGYGFTGQKLGTLDNDEYTLATIVVDVSSSVGSYRLDIEKTIKSIVQSLRDSPRADFLMLRVLFFSYTNNIKEHHGFKELANIGDSDYDGSVRTGGMTALIDATYEGIDATVSYGKILTDSRRSCNAILYVITDGADNDSVRNPSHIKILLDSVWSDESLEGMTTIVIGLGSDLATYIDAFVTNANLTYSLLFSDASVDNLNKLGKFVQLSVMMTSSSLTSGNPVDSNSLSNIASSLQI